MRLILVNTINLHPISHHFAIIAHYQSDYCLWQGGASR